MRQHDFYQAQITRHDGELRIAQGAGDSTNVVTISDAMLPSFVMALAAELAEVQREFGKRKIDEIRRDLGLETTRAVPLRPVPDSDGPGAA